MLQFHAESDVTWSDIVTTAEHYDVDFPGCRGTL
jgi:hypothetical protein